GLVTEPPVTCLHQFVERQAARTPRAVALRFDGGTMTYGELDRRASQLAALLRDRGVGAETLVAMACERSQHMLVALLGIMKAGGAYVPLDLHAPAVRLADVLEQCGNPLVVTTRASRPTVPGVADDDVVYADLLDDRLPVLRQHAAVGEKNLVYVIFTSGSTGRPKGVLTEHAPVVNRLRWMLTHQRLGPADKVLQKTPVFFDVSVWEMFWPLSVGATLVLARPDMHGDTDYLVRTVVEEGITAMHFVPSMLYAFLSHPQVARCTSLTQVFCSGEALSSALQNRFFSRLRARLHNLYGPTETAIEVSYWPCVPGSATVPIGYPIDNVRLYVLDDRQRPVPDGQPGELVIAGLPVARGYIGRPDLTAEVFLDDPYGPPGDRMYRSGDRVLHRPDGAIEYLGRLDDQVKLRGQRIELAEVEACLQGHPWVNRAVVALKSASEVDQRLVGYVLPVEGLSTAGDGLTPGQADIRAVLLAHARDRLPEYMIPSTLMVIEHIPLSPAGKVDRKALPDPLLPGADTAAGRDERQRPRPGLEAGIAALWAEMLNREPGRDDRFLDCGGNSLLATVLAARITHELAVPVTIAQVFAAGSLAELAARAAAARSASSDDDPGSEAPARDDPGFPPARSMDELRLERIDAMTVTEIDEMLTGLGGFR
ncbi:MAG TPA: amino acid adenylation domain-containing protein, partial [Trebonia sp.]